MQLFVKIWCDTILLKGVNMDFYAKFLLNFIAIEKWMRKCSSLGSYIVDVNHKVKLCKLSCLSLFFITYYSIINLHKVAPVKPHDLVRSKSLVITSDSATFNPMVKKKN